jgi:hypothetical protein
LNPEKGAECRLKDYLELIDLTGRCIRADKVGYIEAEQPLLLTRLNISPDNWLKLTKGFRKLCHGAISRQAALTDYCQNQHLKRRQNLRCCEKLLA